MNCTYDHNMTEKPKHIGCLLTKILIIILPIIICIGCSAPPFQAYNGPRRPSFSTSRIKTENETIWFTRIDNIYLEHGQFTAFFYNEKYAQNVEVVPGKHQLYIQHRDLITEADFKVTFEAEAGHIYDVNASLEKFTTYYQIIDETTGETILTRRGPGMD